MEASVTKLMEAEKKVNEKVRQAQQEKTAKLKSIKQMSEEDLVEFRNI